MKLKRNQKAKIYTPSGQILIVDIYPVGILAELQNSWRSKSWKFHLKVIFSYPFDGEWRAFKNSFNGYLAEPDIMPGELRRCGSGWTRKRALRKLQRLVNKRC